MEPASEELEEGEDQLASRTASYYIPLSSSSLALSLYRLVEGGLRLTLIFLGVDIDYVGLDMLNLLIRITKGL